MYGQLPSRARMGIMATLIIAWLAVTATGVSMALPWRGGVENELGTIIAAIAGVTVVIASFSATIGVATEHYRIEWVAAWVAAAALVPYAAATWMDAVRGLSGFDHVFAGVSVVAFLILRAQFCGAHAAKIRARHLDTGGMDAIK